MNNKFIKIKNELKKYHKTKDTLLINYINERLNSSLLNYYSDISNYATSVKNRNNQEKVLKNL